MPYSQHVALPLAATHLLGVHFAHLDWPWAALLAFFVRFVPILDRLVAIIIAASGKMNIRHSNGAEISACEERIKSLVLSEASGKVVHDA